MAQVSNGVRPTKRCLTDLDLPSPDLGQPLDCVPGISTDDWQPEPSPLTDMKPAPGEVIWSALLPSTVANAILELDDDISE